METRISNVDNMYGKKHNIIFTNRAYKDLVDENIKLTPNSLVISAYVEPGSAVDAGYYNVYATDADGNVGVVNRYFIEGNGIEFDETTGTMTLNLDDITLTTTDGNKQGQLRVNLENIIDNHTINIVDGHKLMVNTNNLDPATATTYGVVKTYKPSENDVISPESIVIDNTGTLAVDLNKFPTLNIDEEHPENNRIGLITGVGDNYIKVVNGELSIDEEASHATSDKFGMVKPDNETIFTDDHGVIYSKTAYAGKQTTTIDNEEITYVAKQLGVVAPDLQTTIVNENGLISVLTTGLTKANNNNISGLVGIRDNYDVYGIVIADNDTLVVKDGIIRIKNPNYNTIMENYAATINKLNNKIKDLEGRVIELETIASADKITIDTDALIDYLSEPIFDRLSGTVQEETKEIVFTLSIITNCMYQVSIEYENNANPAIQLKSVTVNNETVNGNSLSAHIFNSTNDSIYQMSFRFKCTNFNDTKIISNRINTNINVNIHSNNNAAVYKSCVFTVSRYNIAKYMVSKIAQPFRPFDEISTLAKLTTLSNLYIIPNEGDNAPVDNVFTINTYSSEGIKHVLNYRFMIATFSDTASYEGTDDANRKNIKSYNYVNNVNRNIETIGESIKTIKENKDNTDIGTIRRLIDSNNIISTYNTSVAKSPLTSGSIGVSDNDTVTLGNLPLAYKNAIYDIVDRFGFGENKEFNYKTYLLNYEAHSTGPSITYVKGIDYNRFKGSIVTESSGDYNKKVLNTTDPYAYVAISIRYAFTRCSYDDVTGYTYSYSYGTPGKTGAWASVMFNGLTTYNSYTANKLVISTTKDIQNDIAYRTAYIKISGKDNDGASKTSYINLVDYVQYKKGNIDVIVTLNNASKYVVINVNKEHNLEPAHIISRNISSSMLGSAVSRKQPIWGVLVELNYVNSKGYLLDANGNVTHWTINDDYEHASDLTSYNYSISGLAMQDSLKKDNASGAEQNIFDYLPSNPDIVGMVIKKVTPTGFNTGDASPRLKQVNGKWNIIKPEARSDKFNSAAITSVAVNTNTVANTIDVLVKLNAGSANIPDETIISDINNTNGCKRCIQLYDKNNNVYNLNSLCTNKDYAYKSSWSAGIGVTMQYHYEFTYNEQTAPSSGMIGVKRMTVQPNYSKLQLWAGFTSDYCKFTDSFVVSTNGTTKQLTLKSNVSNETIKNANYSSNVAGTVALGNSLVQQIIANNTVTNTIGRNINTNRL